MLNDAKVQFATNQEQFVLILDSGLDFIEHMKNKMNKCIKIICMMKKRSLALSIKILLTINSKNYPSLMLNDAKVQFACSQKHLLLILDSRLDLIEHIDNKMNNWTKIIGMMKRRSLALSTKILLLIYNKKKPSLMLNDTEVQFVSTQKYLVLILDCRPEWIQHIDNKINKWNKVIDIMKTRLLALSRKIFLTISNENYPSLIFNDAKVQFASEEKH